MKSGPPEFYSKEKRHRKRSVEALLNTSTLRPQKAGNMHIVVACQS